MATNKRVIQIKRKLEKIPGCKLNAPLSENVIRAVESHYHFELPDDYRQFLTQVGNGGIIPPITEDCDELLPFPTDIKNEGEKLEHLCKPFGFQESELWEDEDSTNWMSAYSGNGFLVLMEDDTDNNEAWLLVVSGVCKGEVWCRTEIGIQRLKDCRFLDWLELHIMGELRSFQNNCWNRKSEKTDLQPASSKFQAVLGCLNRKDFHWNPPISLSEVETFERKHMLSLPVEYRKFITQVANGGEEISGSWHMNSLYDFEDLDTISYPFPFQHKSDIDTVQFKKYFNPLGRSFWEDWATYFPNIKVPDSVSKTWYKKEYSVLQGALPLITIKNEAPPVRAWFKQQILILNGDFSGQIWNVSYFNLVNNQDNPYGLFDLFLAMFS